MARIKMTEEERKARKKENSRRYYLKNKEAINLRSTQWRKENPCRNRENRQQYRLQNLERKREESRLWRLKNPSYMKKYWENHNRTRLMIYHARLRAKRRGLEFSITHDDIVVPDVCPVLGIPLRFGKGKADDNSPALDRIDNKKGYIQGNIVVISNRANRIKSDASLEELRLLVNFYEPLSKEFSSSNDNQTSSPDSPPVTSG